jgi:hypothetical protein
MVWETTHSATRWLCFLHCTYTHHSGKSWSWLMTDHLKWETAPQCRYWKNISLFLQPSLRVKSNPWRRSRGNVGRQDGETVTSFAFMKVAFMKVLWYVNHESASLHCYSRNGGSQVAEADEAKHYTAPRDDTS